MSTRVFTRGSEGVVLRVNGAVSECVVGGRRVSVLVQDFTITT